MDDRLNRLLTLLSSDIASLPKGPGREAMNSPDPMNMWAGLQQLLGGQAMKDPRSLRIMQTGTEAAKQSSGTPNNMDMIMSLIQALLANQPRVR